MRFTKSVAAAVTLLLFATLLSPAAAGASTSCRNDGSGDPSNWCPIAVEQVSSRVVQSGPNVAFAQFVMACVLDRPTASLVDGFWGPLSDQLAKDYQSQYRGSVGKLDSDGIIGESSYRALESELSLPGTDIGDGITVVDVAGTTCHAIRSGDTWVAFEDSAGIVGGGLGFALPVVVPIGWCARGAGVSAGFYSVLEDDRSTWGWARELAIGCVSGGASSATRTVATKGTSFVVGFATKKILKELIPEANDSDFGELVQVRSWETDLCVDVPFQDAVHKEDLWVYTCNATDAQGFYQVGDRLVHAASLTEDTQLCLDIEGNGGRGSDVQLANCADDSSSFSSAQTWTRDGRDLRAPDHPDSRCLDADGRHTDIAPKTYLRVTTCGNAAKNFHLEPFGTDVS